VTRAPLSAAVVGEPLKAVVFDMDGVLFEGHNFWLELHVRYGGDIDDARRLIDRYLESDYAMLAEQIAGRRWRGNPAEPYLELVAERRYQPGVHETLAFLRESEIATMIVSSGPDLLAERAERELGIDAIRANGLEIRDGRITGATTIRVADAEKATVAFDVMRELGVTVGATAAVGDSESDVALAEQVALPIAYDSTSERLTSVATYALAHGELPRLCEIVRSVSG